MFWTSGTINVYKCICEYRLLSGLRAIVTAHFVPVIPGLADGTAFAAIAFGNRVLPFLGPVAQCEINTAIVLATSLSVRINATAESFLTGGGPTPGTGWGPPEAALLIHRVGAGPLGDVLGRMRMGPVQASLFSDPPRFRHFVPTVAALTGIPAAWTAQQAAGDAGYYEVLWNRHTAVATKVDTYHMPTRPGRVWQRAGYPQGRRGPDRH
jgi:hypothetical protein